MGKIPISSNDSELYDRILAWLRRLDWSDIRLLTSYLSLFRQALAARNRSTKENRVMCQQAMDANLAGIKKMMEETKL